MRFKKFIKNEIDNYVILEAIGDFGNLSDEIESIADEIKKNREEKKQKDEEIEKLRADRKSANNAKKKEKILTKIKKLEAKAEKLSEKGQELSDKKKDIEEKGGDKKKSDSEEEKPTDKKPEVPDVEDLPLGKMKDGDVRKLINYYKDMKKYIGSKISGAEAEQKTKYKKSIDGFELEISDLQAELDGRSNKEDNIKENEI